MKANYTKAMQIELTYEGGKDDDPVDPGGRTNQGIIQREYSAWRKSKGLPVRDVFLMEPAERDAIYYQNYGVKIRFDELPDGLDLVILDGAINSGPAQSVKWVQRALGIYADGVLGDVTMQRIKDDQDNDVLIASIIARREAFLRSLKTFSHFGTGWIKRTQSLKVTGQAWASGSVDNTVHTFVANANKKAKLVDAKPMPLTAPADALASGGTVTTALSTIQSVFAPLQDSSQIAGHIVLGLTVAGSVAVAGGLVYGWWARRKRSALADVLDLVAQQPAPAANDDVPAEVMAQYVDPNAQGSATGNIAPGHTTTSGRVAGDTEERKSA